MSKILKSTTLGNVKNGGIFKALGKEFVKLDADEHGCLVLAKDIWTKMPFRDGDDPECPNDLRRSDVMKYLSDRFTEFVQRGTPLDTFIPFKIDLQDTTGQTEYFLSLFVVVLPGGAGWMGSGRFTVRPVKVSGGGQIVYI